LEAELIMGEEERASQIRALLWQHAHPTLRNMDRQQIATLADEILRIATDRGLWTKWGRDREELAERAARVWVPMDGLRVALNALPGPGLTPVDVAQRIREIREKPYGDGYPKRELEAEALALFAEEKASGTEFVAILGHLEDWQYGAEERLRHKAEREHRERVEQEKRRAEARLRNGADCPWTAATGLPDLHCCKNGRLYRLKALKPATKFEPAFEVLRVDHLDAKRGRVVGRYRTRTEASAAVAKVAYQEDDL
jgi:hypothetical protein